MEQGDADFLRGALLEAARESEALPGEADEYGDRYTVGFPICRADYEAKVRSAWIVLRSESVPATHELFCTIGLSLTACVNSNSFGCLRCLKTIHEVVDPSVEYVKGHVHTNGMENFWSLLKRSLNGTYVSVAPFYLFRYVDEQAFRFNQRMDSAGDLGRFRHVLRSTCGKRLTYAEVTGKIEHVLSQNGN